jgi:DNA-directed RNA polymerase I, II, and III subunit RPABC3
MSTDTQLFDENFTITTLDASKYDRVCRLGGTSSDSQTVMTLDINTQLYPCAIGDNIHMVLASSLALDGSKDDGKGWRVNALEGGSLADLYDYVCHGKIYKFEDGEDGVTMWVLTLIFWDWDFGREERAMGLMKNRKVYISFGGLLMAIEGPYKKLTPLRVDYVYLLCKK